MSVDPAAFDGASPGASWAALVVGGLTLAAVAAGEIPRLRMNRATMAVVGAAAIVALGVRTFEAAMAAIDGATLVLLFSMMVLNANLRLGGFFERAAALLARGADSPRRLLAVTVALAGGLSAFLLNDTIALGLTPLVLAMTRSASLPPRPFLMAVATAANVGSVATILGNPQNMIVGTASGIPFLRFSSALAPPAVLGCAATWAILAFVYRRELGPRPPAGRGAAALATASAVPEGNRDLLRKSALATTVLLAALVAGSPVPQAALVCASLLLVTRRTAPERVFAEIDWSLLVFFAGLFVVSDAIDLGLAGLGLSASMEAWVGAGPWSLAAVTVVLSNLVSNVPAVLLLEGAVSGLADAERGFLVLAAASTLAGNLTLLGSVANLIVAEIARRDGVELSFAEYLRGGVPVTLVTLAIAIGWLACLA